MKQKKPVWIDASSETYVVVCDLCHRHDIFLTPKGAKGFAERHAALHKPLCSIPGCDDLVKARGLCHRHTMAEYRNRKAAS